MADVPATINSDGRYYWTGNANGVTGPGPGTDGSAAKNSISFVGDPTLLATGSASLTWTITQRASDGSQPAILYTLDGGVTEPTTLAGSEGTPQEVINESGQIAISLTGATGFSVLVISNGGTPTVGATPWIIAIAITRNVNESIPWDYANAFNPSGYNARYSDKPGYLTDTLANLRVRMMIRLGFSNQASNPPPGMAALINEFLTSAQTFLYRRYLALHMRRMFRWKVIPGQRWYSLSDNDDDPIGAFHIDPVRPIEWAGIQDTRNVWYPVIRGIPPQLYTMITKPWRPARYDIRAAIEVYPQPDQVYFLWLRGIAGLSPFTADGNNTSIDSELVFLTALANAKAHYGQPDGSAVMSQANTYRGELIAGTHGTAHYIPGTIAVPPAVRPTLIQYQDNQSG